MNNNRIIDLDFGPDGALYVADYGGSNFAINNAQQLGAPVRLHRRRRTRRVRTRRSAPNPNPASTTFSFNIGKSGGISYKWDFSDGGTATGANVTHTYLSAGNGVKPTATLTVTYADGADVVEDDRRAGPDDGAEHGHARRAEDARPDDRRRPPRFGGFVPGVGQHLRRQHHGERHLHDAGRPAERRRPERHERRLPGQLGTPLASRLRMRATNAATPEHRVREHHGDPVDLLSWAAPISNDAITLQFQQPIAANEAAQGGGVHQDADVHALDDYAVSVDGAAAALTAAATPPRHPHRPSRVAWSAARGRRR